MSAAIDLLEHQLRPARGEPDGALVLLHGRGTNRFDLLPLLDELDPERRLVGVTPQAPLELSPGGFHWYVSRAFGHPDRGTFHDTYNQLARWLDALPGSVGRAVVMHRLGWVLDGRGDVLRARSRRGASRAGGDSRAERLHSHHRGVRA